jgi:YggT family protein
VSGFLHVFFQLLVVVVWLLVIGRILISWISPRYEGPVARFLFETTEPLIAPIRRVVPQNGMLDWAPLILLFGLGILLRLVLYL